MSYPDLRRSVAAAVSLCLVSSCPGLAPYAAAQAIRSVPAASATSAAPAIAPASAVGGTSFSVPTLMPAAFGLAPSLSAPSAPAPGVLAPAPVAKALISPAAAAAAAAAPVATPAAARPAALAKTMTASAKEAVAALENAGPIAQASPASANGVGRTLEDILTGATALRRGSEVAAPAASGRVDLGDSGLLARPAGDSIRAAVAASVHDADVPAPSAPTPPAPRSPKGPFWPRLLSAGLALAPAGILGLPLLAASAYVVGGLVIATSLALAVMPFLSESSPKVLRGAPGLALAALGAASAGIALSLSIGLGVAVAPSLIWTGALAVIGGWGLTRYGLGRSEGRYGSYGSVETLSAFFGGLASLTGVALAASTPLGWTATALLWLSYPLSTLLWFHLPGWVGKGMAAAFEGLWHGILGMTRVLTAIHRDTVLFERLSRFSERHWNSSKWNGVWLAVMWTPIMLVEAAMYVLSGVAGLAVGLVAAPVNFLWGASAKLWPGSKANVYFAEAARLVFDNVQNGKVARFNPLELKLIPLANSPKFLVSALGSLGIRALQLGWLVYAAIATPLLSVAGLILAFGRVGAYDEKRHDQRRLRINRDDSPADKPSEPTDPEPGPPSKATIAPKLIAVALALVPAYFFGLPILAGASLIQIPLYFGLVLPLAAMPFLGKAPLWAKSFAGRALFYNGLVLLLNGSAIWVGLIAVLGGWGFGRWVKKTQEKGGSFDEAELGAFFGVLGSAAAVGAAWAGFLGGWIGWGTLALAAATSPFLLMHLPSWVWEGLRGVAKSFARSMEAFHDVLGFWHEDTKFLSNLKRHARYWLEKTYWNGIWLSAIWVPVGLIQAAEFVLAVALGAVVGLLRLPFAFAAAAYGDAKPDSRAALFTQGLMDGWKAASEGSKSLFDRLVSGLTPAMDERAQATGRPTAKAAGAFLLARLVQLAWLIGAVAMNLSGIALLLGLYRGVRAAIAGPEKPAA